MSGEPRVSLYIPCYNVDQFIARCIDGVLAQTHRVDEILIIDDGSTDRTIELANRYPVTIVRHPVNKGLGAARNTGLKTAQNELVASLDADCVADPRWLETLVLEMADPNKTVVGGKLVETMLLSRADRWRRAHMSQDWGDHRVDNPPFIYGNNSLARKSVLLRLGGYSESCRTNGEDVGLSKRLRQENYQTTYLPEATVRHLRQDTLRSILDTYWRYWKFGSGAHERETTFLNIIIDIGAGHVLRPLQRVLWPDLQRGNWELLGIDLLLPGYMMSRYAEFLIDRMKQKSRTVRQF